MHVRRCDERFVGYGANKAACLYEIFLAGVQFWAMPNDFLIHQRHPYPENDRRVEVFFFLFKCRVEIISKWSHRIAQVQQTLV
jgi:hypothetical protein